MGPKQNPKNPPMCLCCTTTHTTVIDRRIGVMYLIYTWGAGTFWINTATKVQCNASIHMYTNNTDSMPIV